MNLIFTVSNNDTKSSRNFGADFSGSRVVEVDVAGAAGLILS